MLSSNMKKWKIRNFKQKKLGKFVFHETKRNEQFAICYNSEPLHTRGGKRSQYFFVWDFNIRNITFN